MNIEEAIRTALEYERRIRDIYLGAAEQAGDPAGKRVFAELGADEQRHVDYLKSRLAQWRQSGRIELENLEAAVPDLLRVRDAAAAVESKMDREDRRDEKQMLNKALHRPSNRTAAFGIAGRLAAIDDRVLQIADHLP